MSIIKRTAKEFDQVKSERNSCSDSTMHLFRNSICIMNETAYAGHALVICAEDLFVFVT